MALDPVPAAASPKTRYVVTLLSGTSWTVPAGVTYVIAKLFGGGGAGDVGGSASSIPALSGQVISSTVTTTPGASISYAIGAGGTAPAGVGGTTTFTGAASAVGGAGAKNNANGAVGPTGLGADNAGQTGGPSSAGYTGGNGGQGMIELEYWL